MTSWYSGIETITEEEIKMLKEQIRIMPGGSEYFEAMEHYKALREQALKKN